MPDTDRVDDGTVASDAVPSGTDDALRRALIALKDLRERVTRAERAATEPIAVVGIGCRFPSGANSAEAYWDLLRSGRDGVGTIPADRWDHAAHFDPDPEAIGKIYTDQGGFIDQPVDMFDAGFFGIAPVEARELDPQQRLLLEVTWEALEHAGIAADRLVGSPTGVFVGMSTFDYSNLVVRDGDPSDIGTYSGTGIAGSVAAGRLSYFLGLRGPNLSLDTACSSSLVALSTALQSLRSGACRMALAGGVNLMLDPQAMISLSLMRALSPTGRCHTFGAAADGYVRGEGCGMVVLKRLSDAQDDGDRVLAVIRSAAVNHDGRSSGLTVPSGPAQREVIERALAEAGLDPTDVDFVEAHGTGTDLGDPIEVRALDAVYSRGRTHDRPLLLGSAKTNIGHLEAAAGIAGLIKTVLALQHEEIPPHLHCEELSPRIEWSTMPIEVTRQLRPWPRGEQPRRAAVSAFGFSGTNAHVIVEEAPVVSVRATRPHRPTTLILSARDDAALTTLARNTAAALTDGADPADLAWTLQHGRTRFRRRLAVTATSVEDAAASLHTWDPTKQTARVEHATAVVKSRVAFVYTGQGAQLPGMGRDLYEHEQVFRAVLDECDEALAPHLPIRLLDVMFGDVDVAAKIHDTRYTQPAMFSLQCALAAQWRAWGVVPDVVVGHSIGEYAAAVAAGVMDLPTAARLIAARGRLMSALPGGGRMIAVFADDEMVSSMIAEHAAHVSIAAVNGPTNVVISGAGGSIDQIVANLSAAGVRHRELQVSHAFHSPLMSAIVSDFEAEINGATLREPSIGFVSTVTGRAEKGALASPEYWRDHVLATVRFGAAIDAVNASGVDQFLELGPQPTLLGMIARTRGGELGLHASLRPTGDDRGEREQMLDALGGLWTGGIEPDWRAIDGGTSVLVEAPTYPFQREHYWLERARSRRRDHGAHPLLGAPTRVPALGATLHDVEIDAGSPAWLGDHRRAGTAVLPASAFAEMALAAADGAAIESLAIRESLVLPPDGAVTVQTVVTGTPDRREVQIHSQADGVDAGSRWTLHATATLQRADARAADLTRVDLTETLAGFDDEIDVDEYYAGLHDAGLAYGPWFRGVTRLLRRAGSALGHVRLPSPATDARRYRLHPALLDACVHVIGAADDVGDGSAGDIFELVEVEELRVTSAGATSAWCLATLLTTPTPDDESIAARIEVFGEDGSPIASVSRLVVRRTPKWRWERDLTSQRDRMFDLAWRPLPRPDVADGTDDVDAWKVAKWVVVASDEPAAARLVSGLAESGTASEAVIVPSDPDALGPLLESAIGSTEACRTGVVSLCGFGASPPGTTTDPAALAEGALRQTLAVAHAATRAAGTVRMWIVSCAGQSVDGEAPSVGTAAVWGLGRVIATEQPQLACTCIDVASLLDDDAVDELRRELTERGDDQVALRGRRRFVARLVPHAPASSSSPGPRIRDDGAYLVTGGLGGIGLAVAAWLVEQGARHLTLVGRSAPTAEANATIDDLRASGASVSVLAGDVADRADVDAFIAATPDGTTLRGIFHAAGTVSDAALAQQTWSRFASVLAPKLLGALHLDVASRSLDLDHFVLFSSSASLFGSPGQANYAAANAAMDALAHRRRAEGRPALTINWGPWADVGMAARLDAREQRRMADRGVRALTTVTALDALGTVLDEDCGQVAVVDIDWSRMLAPIRDVPSLLTEVAAAAANQQSTVRVAESGSLPDALAGLVESERLAVTVAHVGAEIAAVLGLARAEQIDTEQELAELGLDSLMVVELTNRLRSTTGLPLSADLTFEYSTALALAEQILELLASGRGADAISTAGDADVDPRALPVVPVDRGVPVPASSAQMRLLFVDRFAPGLAFYNLPLVIRLRGPLAVDVLGAAVARLVDRHEALRTNFVDRDGVVIQDIVAADDVGSVFRVHQVVESDALDELVRDEVSTSFDLHAGPKLRAAVFVKSPDESLFVMTTHHIATDGWSITRLIAELTEIYSASVTGREPLLPDLPVQYADWSVWHRSVEQSATHAEGLAYWAETLGGTLPVLDLPTDRPRPALQSYRSGTLHLDLDADLMAGIGSAARRAGVTPFVFMLAGYMATLARWSGQDDVVVGTASANRARPEISDTVGLFVNMVGIRATVDLERPFLDLVEAVRAASRGAFVHEGVPFDRIVDEINPPRDLSRSIVFQTTFVLNNMPIPGVEIAGLDGDLVDSSTGATEHDLACWVTELDDRPRLLVEFNADVFDASTVGRLAGHWQELLSSAVADPSVVAGGLSMMSVDERAVLLSEFACPGSGASGVDGVVRVDELVALRVLASPDRVAFGHGDEVMTYGEWDRRANVLARRLVDVGVVVGDRVGVAVERSTSMVVAVLAVMKAGAAYVPLDPSLPVERLAFMVENSGVRAVVASSGALGAELRGDLDVAGVSVVEVPGDWSDVVVDGAVPVRVDSSHLPGGGAAWVIYTSGSTGVPKGVEVEHASAINFLLAMQREPGMVEADVVLAVPTLSFDPSVLDVFVPSLVGARVVIADRDDVVDVRRLQKVLASSGATVVQATPTTWSALLESGWAGSPRLKALCGGEAMPVDLAARLLACCGSVWNLYGPTETTVWSTVHRVEQASLRGLHVPIGRPIANLVYRVLDGRDGLAPIGVPGEVVIGGVGVARGYVNRPDLTAERFVVDPFDPQGRVYRTGDLARWLPDGNLEFLGRSDFQIKIRGNRVELGEVEVALRAHGGVRDAVVVADGEGAAMRLVAYLVAAVAGVEPDISELRSTLLRVLPDYMVPAVFVWLEELPLTPSRKIDRGALPTPEAGLVATSTTEYVAPRDDVERVIAGIVAEAVGVERVGVDDDFFELGGHSLQATAALAAIETTLGARIDLRTFFLRPTVGGAAAAATSDPTTRSRVERVAEIRARLAAMSPEEVAQALAERQADVKNGRP